MNFSTLLVMVFIFYQNLALGAGEISNIELDAEIIKNLDFYQNLDLIKLENPINFKKISRTTSSEEQIKLQDDNAFKSTDFSQEKKQ